MYDKINDCVCNNDDTTDLKDEDKYDQLLQKLNKINSLICDLAEERRELNLSLDEYTKCDFCSKHFKKCNSNNPGIKLTKTEIVDEFSGDLRNFDDSEFVKTKYVYSYTPYVCPYCNKPQVSLDNIVDHSVVQTNIVNQ